MSLSLVPEYDSASSSDSESEPVSKSATSQAHSKIQHVSDLGAKLSSILPPPKNSGKSAYAPSEDKKQVQIVVNLPPSRAKSAAPADNSQSKLDTIATASSTQSAGKGSLFAELSSILPAPKNALPPTSKSQVDSVKNSTSSRTKPSNQPLIPHTVSSKHKAQIKADTKSPVIKAAKPDSNLLSTAAVDADKDSNPAADENSEPFFSFGTDEAVAVEPYQEHDDSNTDKTSIDKEAYTHAQPSLIYDPTTGYYYDNASGVYYYYDSTSGNYIDAQSLYQATESHAQIPDQQDGDPSAIDSKELENLIGRSSLRRGEAQLASSSIKAISQSAQLAGSGYSDAKAAAEYSARQAIEQQRRKTRRIISEQEVGQKKKQKHNIMYLAYQAQEQEDELKEAHANRKRARNARRSKYGY
ncbi:hypothetical protein IWW36_000407 [Coemansia brasiliensis]|uniref:OCRE domain-containing protein n=1 Tax=Coemansia brasiliensis TaxID=2650707 RepID=A0A9W8LZZ5_9FUNG|nr:hypothetical protein IWW36_000407 [Coemansia brasiliensis]